MKDWVALNRQTDRTWQTDRGEDWVILGRQTDRQTDRTWQTDRGGTG